MQLESALIRNYRALADVELDLRPINVFFGPNAAGKSSFFDVLWFIRDCATHGVEKATADRDHGIGLLWDGDGSTDAFSIELRTARARYETRFQLQSGRIDSKAGEFLVSSQQCQDLHAGP